MCPGGQGKLSLQPIRQTLMSGVISVQMNPGGQGFGFARSSSHSLTHTPFKQMCPSGQSPSSPHPIIGRQIPPTQANPSGQLPSVQGVQQAPSTQIISSGQSVSPSGHAGRQIPFTHTQSPGQLSSCPSGQRIGGKQMPLIHSCPAGHSAESQEG